MAEDQREGHGDDGGEDLAALPSFSREPAAMLTADQRAISQRAKDHADEGPGDLPEQGGGPMMAGPVGAVVTILVTALFVVLWRMWCEIVLVMFKILERLGEVRDRLKP